MTQLHQELQSAMIKAEALCQAQLALLRGKDYKESTQIVTQTRSLNSLKIYLCCNIFSSFVPNIGALLSRSKTRGKSMKICTILRFSQKLTANIITLLNYRANK